MIKFFILLSFLGLCASRRFENPVFDLPNDEPNVVKYNGLYYTIRSTYVGTVPIYVSSDLENWENKSYVFSESDYPEWVESKFIIAPEIEVLGDKDFRVYFWSFDQETGEGALGVAAASDILGPYIATDGPIYSNATHDVRMPSLMNDNGTLYLLYAGWVDGLIFGQQLREDGLGFVDGEATVLLEPTLEWEGYYLEAPTGIVTNDYYYIFYSHYHFGCSGKGNGTGVARSKSPLGPYEKCDQPILLPTDDKLSPEEPSIVKDVDDIGDVLLFQSTFVGCDGPYLCAASMAFNSEGWPYVMDYE